MVRIQSVLLTCAIVLACMAYYGTLPRSKSSMPVEVKKAYATWCIQFGKLRISPAEHDFRMIQFKAAFEFVQRHNASPDKSHTVSLNQFADLTDEEFTSTYIYKSKEKEPFTQGYPDEHPSYAKYTNLGQETETIDMRNMLQQQSMQSSATCNDNYAWISAVNMNANYYMKQVTSIKYSFSPQFYIDCSAYYGNIGCDGGKPIHSYEYSIMYGAASLSDYPYFGEERGCRATMGMFSNVRAVISPKLSNSYLANYISKQTGVASVGMDMASKQARFYSGGIFEGPCTTEHNHNLLLIGMGVDESTSKPYWTVMNTWGSFWGDQGVMKVVRHEIDNDSRYSSCGLNMWATYPEF